MPTVAELKADLRAKGLQCKGSKLELQLRLELAKAEPSQDAKDTGATGIADNGDDRAELTAPDNPGNSAEGVEAALVPVDLAEVTPPNIPVAESSSQVEDQQAAQLSMQAEAPQAAEVEALSVSVAESSSQVEDPQAAQVSLQAEASKDFWAMPPPQLGSEEEEELFGDVFGDDQEARIIGGENNDGQAARVNDGPGHDDGQEMLSR